MIQNLLTSARRSTMQLRINRAYSREERDTGRMASPGCRRDRYAILDPCRLQIANCLNADRNMLYTVSYTELTICELPNSNICSASLSIQEIFLYMCL